MRHLVLNSHKLQRGQKIDVIPFRLDPTSAQEPTEFEVVFIIGSIRYVYGFSADQDEIWEEWLTEADLNGLRIKPRARVLFERERQPDGTYTRKFGEHWKPKKEQIVEDTLENQLYLAKFAQNNHKLAGCIFDWFRGRFRTMSNEPEDSSELAFTADLCERDIDVRTKVNLLLRHADLGIEDFVYNQLPINELPEWLKLSEDERKQILTNLGSDSDKEIIYKIITKHLMADGVTPVDFNLSEDESDGTRRLFALAGPFIHSMLNGNVLFCDELDSSLHPMLTRALIDMVHHQSNTSFQFIFTTHDCSLLDADLFRRDQIWFTEKRKDMSTDLYSLWDIKPRPGENFRKGYLNGRYGAIPFLGEFTF